MGFPTFETWLWETHGERVEELEDDLPGEESRKQPQRRAERPKERRGGGGQFLFKKTEAKVAKSDAGRAGDTGEGKKDKESALPEKEASQAEREMRAVLRAQMAAFRDKYPDAGAWPSA